MAKAKKSVLQTMSSPVLETEISIDVPNNWKWARLIQVYNFIDYRGKTPTKIEKGIPLVTAKNIRKGYLDYSIAEYISEEEYKKRQTRGISHCGDILFTTEAPMGNVAIADLDVFSAGQRVITFQKYAHTNWANNKFYYYYILSEWFQGELDRQKTGSTVAGIKAEKLMRFPVPVPPITEQQRIVDRIESLFAKLDEAKEKAQAVVDGFEDRKAAILHKAFTGELTTEWRKKNSVGNNSWELLTFDDCIDVMQNGISKRKGDYGEPYIVLRLANLSDDGFDEDDLREILLDEKEQNNYELKSDDVLMIRVNGSKDNVGKQYHITDQKHWAFCDHIIRIRYANSIMPKYMVLFSQSEVYRQYIEDNMVSSAGQNTISRKGMARLQIPMPKKDEQAEIIAILTRLFEKERQVKEAAEQVIDQIDAMKKSVLARAFRGELGTNDPVDESAEELLKRIL